MPSRAAFLATLPRKRVTAGAVIRDEAGRVLLLQPTYRPDWLTPGGSVEADESPARAADREVQEELGMRIPIGRLLVVQWDREADDPDGVLHFTYDGGVLSDETIRRIRLEQGIASFRFVEPAVLAELAAGDTCARVAAALQALQEHRVIELDTRSP